MSRVSAPSKDGSTEPVGAAKGSKREAAAADALAPEQDGESKRLRKNHLSAGSAFRASLSRVTFRIDASLQVCFTDDDVRRSSRT